MNELDHDLESELRALHPAAPPPGLNAAIARELNTEAGRAPSAWTRRARMSLWTSWTLTAAAAAVAAAAWWPPPTPPAATSAVAPSTAATTESEARVVPVGSTNVLLDARNEGIVVFDDGRAAHRVRLRFVDTVQLQDRDSSSAIAVSRPREEVRFVPVNFY